MDVLPILVDGQPMKVTKILESFLQHARVSFSSLSLWVDALCINQQSASIPRPPHWWKDTLASQEERQVDQRSALDKCASQKKKAMDLVRIIGGNIH